MRGAFACKVSGAGELSRLGYGRMWGRLGRAYGHGGLGSRAATVSDASEQSAVPPALDDGPGVRGGGGHGSSTDDHA